MNALPITLVTASILGLMLAGRLMPKGKGAWVQEVHQYLGGLATVFTGIQYLIDGQNALSTTGD